MKTLAPQSGHVSNSRGLRQALLDNMMALVIHEVIRGIQTDIQTGHPDGMRLGLDGLQDVASRSSSSSLASCGHRLCVGLQYSGEAKSGHYYSEVWFQPWCRRIAACARPS